MSDSEKKSVVNDEVSLAVEQRKQEIAALQEAQKPLLEQPNPVLVSGMAAVQQAQAMNQQAPRVLDPDAYFPGMQPIGEGVTVFLYGGVGSRKTTWAALWPKPVFLSVGQEGGDEALAMLPSLYGMPVPPVIPIKSTSQMAQKVDLLCANYLKWDINTVVVDSTTYYVDLWIHDLLKRRYPGLSLSKLEEAGMAAAMINRDWGLLSTHLKDLSMKLHATKLNVIWTALEKPEKVVDARTNETRVTSLRPFLPGEAHVKLPGMCKMIIHTSRVLKPNPNNPLTMLTQPVFYTSPTSLTKDYVRHKYGNAFPEGVLTDSILGDMPTFRAIYERIGNFVYMT